ncbi:MAG TPA: hypothetical protein VGS58_12590, partial [Candidatus Sulfopaludibacter sp.]|nr:hypothetical protein [Candidatus Sulfopaludibacter sp.]
MTAGSSITLRIAACLLAFVCLSFPQRRVDPKNTYNRIICVVPLTGKGTASDPRRPEYAAWPVSQAPNGIIAFSFVPSDDGKSA